MKSTNYKFDPQTTRNYAAFDAEWIEDAQVIEWQKVDAPIFEPIIKKPLISKAGWEGIRFVWDISYGLIGLFFKIVLAFFPLLATGTILYILYKLAITLVAWKAFMMSVGVIVIAIVLAVWVMGLMSDHKAMSIRTKGFDTDVSNEIILSRRQNSGSVRVNNKIKIEL